MLPFVDPMARFCKTIIRDNRNWIPSYGLNIWMSARWIRHACSGERRARNPAHWRRHGKMMEGLNKVMHGEPRQEKELVSWQMISTFSTPPLSCIWRGAKRRAGGGRVAPLGRDHRNALNLEQASDIVERMGSEIADNHWQHGGHFRLMG